ncbi:HNH endonuclease family protein [Krasilnikovia sp. MM14-A1259]|uniref:HNH endonuclease family protein n=1 Tax=Krasilnikovia sp. MM14-A1259 TaxID=3373539 RepID=UPI00380B3391
MSTPVTTPRIFVRGAAALALVLAAAGGCTGTSGGSPAGGTAPNTHATGTAKAATQQLAGLAVAAPGSMRGYSRAKFPHWQRTGANCDVRDSVLKRDGSKVKMSGCNVVGGAWTSVYDGKAIDSPTLVDIDHVVPLANAWRSGASAWTTPQREQFANDLDDPQLVAVSQGSNRAKGDQDPSTWKPPAREHWCEYAQDWVAVKTHWKLTVTSAEKAALADMLETC